MAKKATAPASKPQSAAVKPAPAPSKPAAGQTKKPSREEIAKRAYEIYLRRGGIHGSDRDDWLAAERELTEGK